MLSATLAAGNVTECKSPAVYRQAAYKHRLKQQLHPDMSLELQMQKQDWMASERAGNPNGFIRTIGDSPYFCTSYLRQQVELFLEVFRFARAFTRPFCRN